MPPPFALGGSFFTSTVARRAFALFIACALLPVSALAVVTLHQVTTQLQEQAQRRLRQASKGIGLTTLHRLVAAEADLARIGTREPSGLQSRFTAATIVAADDTVTLVFGQMSPPALGEAQRARLMAGKTVLSVVTERGHGARAVLSRAVDPARPARGVIHGLLDPDALWAIDEEGSLPVGCHLLILDHTGRVLFSLADAERPVVDHPVLPASRRGGGGDFTWHDGGTTYLAARWALFLQPSMGVADWTVVVSQPRDDVLAPITTFKRVFVLVLVLTVLIVLLLSAQQIRRHLTPLAQLKDAARRIAQGDLTTRVHATSRDEFAEVAGAFNDMTDQLDRQFHTLALRREITAAVNPAQPVDEFLEQSAAALMRHLGLAGVSIWLPDRDPASFTLRAAVEWPAAADGTPATLPLTPADLVRLSVDHQPIVCAASGLVRPVQAGAAHADLADLVAHPLVVEGRLVGIVCALGTRPFQSAELGTLAVAAAEIGRGVDRKRLDDALQDAEMQTRQLQKMEAVGRLAGGIAHDFNNLLTVITGRTYLLMHKLPTDHPHWKSINTIDATAQRAAQLTRQLLAFSRKQVLAPTVLDLNEVVTGLQEILRRLIGEPIELTVAAAPDLGRSKLDRSQVEQVLVNLVVNARDAMPQGGRIRIETSNVELDETLAREDRVGSAGPHVLISVTDTGTGMDEQTRARIFEPFFTTKEVGKGTGLGLATVLGIVQQSGGHIRVESELGVGTTFRIYFPRLASESAPAATGVPEKPRGGDETVLLVDDEVEVQAVLKSALTEWGYTVLGVTSPTEALRTAAQHRGPIHVLLTDLVMPEMGGQALAQRLAIARPGIAALYMSGYTDTQAEREPEGARVLQKPFSPELVARAVREVLDGAPAGPDAMARGAGPIGRKE
jgi:signal transduction histidine kinase